MAESQAFAVSSSVTPDSRLQTTLGLLNGAGPCPSLETILAVTGGRGSDSLRVALTFDCSPQENKQAFNGGLVAAICRYLDESVIVRVLIGSES
jgi:hypothetical protein